MNSKERVARVMRKQKPDRTPFMCQLSDGHIYRHAGIDPVDYFYTSAGHAMGFIRMAERYKMDGIIVDCYGIDPEIPRRIANITQQKDGHRIMWKDGNATFVPLNDTPYPLQKQHPRRSRGIHDMQIPDRPSPALESDLPVYYFDVLEAVIAQKGKELSIHGEVCSPFSAFLYRFDSFEQGLIGLLDDPDKSRHILDVLTYGVTIIALAECRRGINALKISSAFAGAGFISRGMYAEFVLPYEKRIIDTIHKQHDVPVYLHTCGHIGDRLDLMVASGTDGIECLDPPPLGSVDLGRAVAEIGAKVWIKGNLDSVNELSQHTPEEVKEIAKRRIAIGRKAKGYILSSACSVSPCTPPENVTVLYDAVEEYGRN